MSVNYDFAPSTQPQTISAGQWCGATLGGGGPTSVDCATGAQGRISPIVNLTAIEFQTLTPSVPVTVTVAGWSNTCTLGGNSGNTCTTGILYLIGPPPDVVMALSGSQQSPVAARIEVLSVGIGAFPDVPPLQNPGSDVVGPLRAGQTVRAGQAVTVGPYKLTMARDGQLGEFAHVGNDDYRVFTPGTAVPGSTLIARADGSIALRSPKGGTLWSSDDTASTSYAAEGNLVLYSKRHRRLWSSNGPLAGPATRNGARALTLGTGDGVPAGGQLTAGATRLTMQADGDLVLTRGGKVRWQSRTQGQPGAYLQIRHDGNAVLYSLDHPRRAARSSPGPGATAAAGTSSPSPTTAPR